MFGCLSLGLGGIRLLRPPGIPGHGKSAGPAKSGSGWRLALRKLGVVRAILGEAVVLVTGGLLFGVLLAWLSSRSVSALLFGLSAMDPLTVSGMAVLLVLVGVVAAYLPARRAARVGSDERIAMRIEPGCGK